MKILIISTLYPGYQQQGRSKVSYAIHYFAQEWANSGHEVRVIRPWIKYPKVFTMINKAKAANKYGFNDELTVDSVHINRVVINKFPKIDFTKKSIKTTYKDVEALINSNSKPDIIVCHMLNPSIFVGLLVKRKYDIPIFLTMHSSDLIALSKRGLVYKKYSSIKDKIDGLGFRSTNLKEKYNELFSSNEPTNQFLVLSGIDSKYILSQSEMCYKAQKKSCRLFVASNLIPQKNIDVLIKAFLKVNSQSLFLEIAGDGPEKDRLEDLANNSPYNNIKFLGWLDREEILAKMKTSDIFVMVSSPETFGLVYLEAMASGCIAIGAKREGIDGIIQNGENGFLCEPRNVDDLANTIDKIANLSKESKERLLINALGTIKGMTHKGVSDNYIEALQHVIAQSKVNKNENNPHNSKL